MAQLISLLGPITHLRDWRMPRGEHLQVFRPDVGKYNGGQKEAALCNPLRRKGQMTLDVVQTALKGRKEAMLAQSGVLIKLHEAFINAHHSCA